jgi:tetratricopeptide (TPR) repeat protein
VRKCYNESVTGGYYQLGYVFHKTNRDEQAVAFFEKVVSIWKEAFLPGKDLTLDSARVAEALQMLNSIYSFRIAKNNESCLEANEALFILAQVYEFSGQIAKAREHASRALVIYEVAYGREHSVSIKVRTFLKKLLTPTKH